MSANEIHVDLFSDCLLHPKAYHFFNDDSRFCLALAGRRGAKSYTGARRFWRLVWMRDWPAVQGTPYNPGAAKRGTALWWDRRPRLHYWVVADEYALLDEPKRYLLQFLPPELLDHTDNQKGRWWLKGDILIEFKTAHDPKSLVGSGLNGVWVEEADRCKQDTWRGYLEPTTMDKGGWAQFTTTPLGKTWTYTDIEMHAKNGVDGYGFHTWRSIDNTRIPDIAGRIERARQTLPAKYFKREYEASREAFLGQIYDEFDEDKMVRSLPKDVTLYSRAGGQDWGFTNPGAAIVTGASSRDLSRAAIWVVDEHYQASRLVEDHWVPKIRAMNAKWKMNDWSCDPEAPDDIARYKDAGINAFPHRNFTASKYDEPQRSVKAGIRLIAALMHQGRFFITPECKETISELKDYRWKQAPGSTGSDDSFIEEPAPGQRNHGCDAMRYSTTSLMRGANFEAMGIAA